MPWPKLDSYQACLDALNGRQHRKVYRNTKLVQANDGIELYYHDNLVALRSHDLLWLSSCGWRTLTTKQRINWMLPRGYHLFSSHYAWYLETPAGIISFTDGMVLYV